MSDGNIQRRELSVRLRTVWRPWRAVFFGFVCSVFFLTFIVGVKAEPPTRVWAEIDVVRDTSDTVHLKPQSLRSWNETDLDPLPIGRSLPDDFKPLWKSVLTSQDVELRRNALLSIGQVHQGGYADFSDLAEAVRETFNRDDLRVITRLDAARTLVILDARAAAPDLMKYLDGIPALRLVAEPAFADWDYQPARVMWMKRLKNPNSVPRSDLLLALRGLSQVGHSAAGEDMRKIVLSSKLDAGLRLTAAQALAELQTSGLDETSRQLLSPGTEPAAVSALLAATLLRRHSGEATEQFLLPLLGHSAGPVAAKAWERLNELNPDGIPKSVLDQTLHGRDARLRLLAVRNCGHRSQLHVDLLIAALDDVHPDVRSLARHVLRDRDRKAARENDDTLDQEIRAAASLALTADFSWRGLEQACLLVGELDHKPVAALLAGLLTHKRNEVASSAAWSLKELAVEDVLPQMLAYAEQLDSQLESDDVEMFTRAELVQTHLFESFAELNYQPADSLLRKYIPKQTVRYEARFSRMSAIRTLAYFSGGKPEADLVSQLTERMFDRSLIQPELFEVVTACALAFGIMKTESRLADLRKLAAEMGPNQPPGRAAYWSIHQLTGETIPPKIPVAKSRARWFLTPVPLESR